MILILSRQNDLHVPVITRRLDARGEPYLWFDPGDFPSAADVHIAYSARGFGKRVLRTLNGTVDLESLKAVWYRRPGQPEAATAVTRVEQRRWVAGVSKTCLWGVWESMNCRWVPGKPSADSAGVSKVTHLALAAGLGFRIPRTLITNNPEDFLQFYADCGGQVVTKLEVGVAWDDPDGDSYQVFTHAVRRRDASRCRAIRYAPLIAQEYVQKRFELRITVVGTQVFAAAIDSQASRATRHDWRHYDNRRAKYAPHTLPAEVEQLCISLVRSLDLCFAAIDMVVTPDGEYVFLEVNPNGQWLWVEELTGLPIADALTDLLTSSPAGVMDGFREFHPTELAPLVLR